MVNKTIRLHLQKAPPHGAFALNRYKNTFLIAAAVLLLCGAVFVGGVAGDQGPFPDGGALTSQTYTLTSNVTLMTNLTVPNGVTCTIDLAGHVLKGNGSGSVITVNTGGVLTLKDSNPNSDHHFNTSTTPWVWDSTEASGNVVKGGCITGGSDSAGGGVWNSGTFEMTGGNIVGNSALGYGGGVYVYSGTFNMSGTAEITGNIAPVYGGGVCVYSGTFNMSGTAEITGNSAGSMGGGGVYVNGGTFKVSGAPEISGNKKRTGEEATDNNVYLYGDSKITITGALQDDPGTPTKYAEIGIANPLSGQFGAGSNSPSYSVQPADAACFFQDGNEQVRGVVTGSNDLYWPVAKIVTSGTPSVTTYYATVAEAVGAATEGQTIEMIGNSNEPTVTVGKTVTLNLAGFVLKNNGSGTDKSVINVVSGGNLRVIDENPVGTPAAAEHYFKYVKDGAWIYAGDTEPEDKACASFILNGTGANFTREAADAAVGSAPSGKSVYIKVTGGCITGGSAPGNGGGVYVNDSGTFNMSGGNIVGNTATGGGGGVSVAAGGSFEMSGGNIVGNSASDGGGVFVYSGTFNMSGTAEITGNSASLGDGGGVYVAAGGSFEMSGGSITENSASLGGGGVCVYSGTFTMQDSTTPQTHGTITENSASLGGGGVFVYSGTFNVSGAPVISGNTLTGGTTASNVYLNGDNNLTVTGPLNSSASIGIASPLTGKFGAGTTEEPAHTVTATDAACFFQDGNEQVRGAVKTTAPNELHWAVAQIGTEDGAKYYATVSDAVTDASTTTPYDTITMIANSEEPTVTVGKTVTLNLAGFVLKNNGSGTGDKSVIKVETGGNLTLTDSESTVEHKFTIGTDGLWIWNDSATEPYETLTGGCITGGNTATGSGGGVYVNGGTFNMSGGNIVGNTATGSGGGVFVAAGGSFEMSGGSITGNTAQNGGSNNGGGVFVAAGGTFNMSGTAEITENSATGNGGGVFVSGTFNMSGTAEITGNSALFGGGVYVAAGGTFNMSGGSITENSATGNGGGGVYVYGTFTMTGTAEITGNSATGNGGGVYVLDGTFEVSGAPEISGNKKGTGEEATDNNVYLYGAKTITLIDPFLSGDTTKIGVTSASTADSIPVTDTSYNADYSRYFISDSASYVVQNTGSGSAQGIVLVKAPDVAQIGGDKYPTVAAAVAAVPDSTETTITMIANSAELTVSIPDNKKVILDLNGYVLRNKWSDSTVISVSSDGNLTVTDSSTEKYNYFKYKPNGAWEYIPAPTEEQKTGATALSSFTRSLAEDTVIKVPGGSITGGSAGYGGGVCVAGEFTMSGGNIVGNSAPGYGGGVCVVDSGTFNMSGGSITGNSAPGYGGGVCVAGEFTMSGGSITGNSASLDGGGVYVWAGTFTMQDSADPSPTHGTITGNTATGNGGGVFVGDTFKVSGSPVISGNTMGGNADNVYLANENRLKLTGNLTGGEIRITKAGAAPPSKGEPFGITGSVDYTGAEHFVADGDTPLVGSIETGTANLVWATPKPTTYTVTFNVQGHGNNFTQTVTSGSTATKPADPTASGYTFGGWYTEDTCENPYEFSTPVTANITLYAKWTKNSSGGSSSHSGSSVWAQPISTVPGDNTVATDVTYQYTGQKFIPVSAANLEQISAADPAAAAAVEMVLQTATAAGIPVTNSKGAKALVNTTESIAGLQTETFTQIIDVESADGTKVTSVPFKVRLSDLAAKNLTTDDVTLYHYLEEYGLWIPLETRLVSTDSTYAYYEAATDGASPFGVLLKKLDAPEVKPIPTKTPAGKSPVPFMGVLAGLGAAAVVFGLRMRR